MFSELAALEEEWAQVFKALPNELKDQLLVLGVPVDHLENAGPKLSGC